VLSGISFPILHFGNGYPEGFLHSDWRPDPQFLLTGFLLIAGYLLSTNNGPINRRYPGWEARTVTPFQRRCWIAGALVMTIVLGPPFHDWGDYYLVSVHMAQHLILMYVVAPLLLLGVPRWWFNPISRRPVLDRIGRAITMPVPSFLIGNAIMIAWHLPSLYDAALNTPFLHATQHTAFMISGFFTWWSLIGPNPRWHKATPIIQCLLLFAETIPGGIVGMMITLSSPGVYSYYDNVPRLWGISLAADQTVAGTMMAVGVPVFFLALLTVIFLRWAGREEAKDRQTPVKRSPAKPDAASIS
jgi:cytochrome c oxidase assembly factor CtaG